MKQIILIFALLFLISCEETTFPNFQCGLMTFSDALPVQFWQQGCSTYNQTVPKGVHEKCFCAPWLCDDQIRIQFQENVSPDEDYFLIAQNSGGEIIANLAFTEIDTGVHSVAFSPETEGICDELINLLIIDEDAGSKILAPDTGWTDEIGTWTKTAIAMQVDVTNAAGQKQLSQPIDVPLNAIISEFTVLITITGTWTGTAQVYIEPRSSAGSFSASSNITSQNYNANTTDSSLVVAATVCDLFAAELLRIRTGFTGTGTATIKVEVPVGDIIYLSSDDAGILAKSDCLNIAITHDETELIEYSNARNFAGLIHANISPDASFNIRVPCRFFHEIFPEEDEAIELTSSVITTSGQLKSQKLLEVQHVPYYFHKKLQLILKHHTLTINGTEYQKEEKYEIIEGNKRWPLKSATCLLTEKNSVLRNVI